MNGWVSLSLTDVHICTTGHTTAIVVFVFEMTLSSIFIIILGDKIISNSSQILNIQILWGFQRAVLRLELKHLMFLQYQLYRDS